MFIPRQSVFLHKTGHNGNCPNKFCSQPGHRKLSVSATPAGPSHEVTENLRIIMMPTLSSLVTLQVVNLQCHQLWQSWHHDDSWLSVQTEDCYSCLVHHIIKENWVIMMPTLSSLVALQVVNLQCHQWWQNWHLDDSQFLMQAEVAKWQHPYIPRQSHTDDMPTHTDTGSLFLS